MLASVRAFFDSIIPRAYSCAYCGRVDPEFRCGKCLVALYCNKKCQTADWPTHRPVCIRARCARCGVANPRFFCAGCGDVSYCSKECQAAHWPKHAPDCAELIVDSCEVKPKLRKK